MSPSYSHDYLGSVWYLQRAQISNWSGTIFCHFLQQTGSSETSLALTKEIFRKWDNKLDECKLCLSWLQQSTKRAGMSVTSQDTAETLWQQMPFLWVSKKWRSGKLSPLFFPYICSPERPAYKLRMSVKMYDCRVSSKDLPGFWVVARKSLVSCIFV